MNELETVVEMSSEVAFFTLAAFSSSNTVSFTDRSGTAGFALVT